MSARRLLAGTLVLVCVVVGVVFGSSVVAWGVEAPLPVGVPGLADNRAYEQVSPVDKNGLDALGYDEVVHASPSGDAVSFFATGALPGALGGAATGLNYVARRGVSGWATRGLAPPAGDNTLGYPEVLGSFPDYSKVLVSTIDPQPAPGGPPGQFNIFEQDTATGAYRFFAPNPIRARFVLAAVTPDDSHFIFEDEEQLVPAATPGRANLYESTDGQISLVGVLPGPGGKAPPRGSVAGGQGAEEGEYTQPDHVLSDDGSRVFFTDPETKDLYVRENADTLSATTVLVAEDARFQTASADGSLVFFTKGEEHNEGLYAYNVVTGQATELSAKVDAMAHPFEGFFGGVLGVGGSGNDVYVYFAAESVLAGSAVEDQPNVYAAHYNGAVWAVDYIATVAIGEPGIRIIDRLNWATRYSSQGGSEKVSRVTPDGRTLLFTSTARITNYDNAGNAEVYLYEAENKQVTCVSCDPTGEPATTDPYLAEGAIPGASSGLYTAPQTLNPVFPTHALSDSGTRVFFGTTESLVVQDTNGMPDVYEWEKDGSGSCVQAGGCLSLISSGRGAEGSYIGDASANGNDVFFFTHQSLVAGDEDELQDVYDARVDAGVVPVAPPACSGSGCQGVPPAPPIFATPSSVTFNGVGNFPVASSKPKTVTKQKAKKKPGKHKRSRHKRRVNMSAGHRGRGGK
jgi:hypothetical protein